MRPNLEFADEHRRPRQSRPRLSRLESKALERATAFYKDVLGLPFLFDVPGQFSFFQLGPTRLMLEKPGSPEFDHPNSIFYFKVPAIEQAFERLSASGAEIVHTPRLIAEMPDHALWMGFFKDSEGNTLALMEEKASPPGGRG